MTQCRYCPARYVTAWELAEHEQKCPQRLAKMGPHYGTACDLARGFCCGNCDRDQAHEWRCEADGCASLRDGIYEEIIVALKRANAGDGTAKPADRTPTLTQPTDGGAA